MKFVLLWHWNDNKIVFFTGSYDFILLGIYLYSKKFILCRIFSGLFLVSCFFWLDILKMALLLCYFCFILGLAVLKARPAWCHYLMAIIILHCSCQTLSYSATWLTTVCAPMIKHKVGSLTDESDLWTEILFVLINAWSGFHFMIFSEFFFAILLRQTLLNLLLMFRR